MIRLLINIITRTIVLLARLVSQQATRAKEIVIGGWMNGWGGGDVLDYTSYYVVTMIILLLLLLL